MPESVRWRRLFVGSFSLVLWVLLIGTVLLPADGLIAQVIRRTDNNDHDRPRVRWDVVDRRLTWMHWWEANRNDYLLPILEKQPKLQPKQFDPVLFDQSVDALIKATRHDGRANPALHRLRLAATQSLGRVGGDKAVERLLELTQDPDHSIRPVAWTALAATGSDKAREQLLTKDDLGLADRLSRAAALGMLKPGDEEAIALLGSELLGGPGEVAQFRRVAMRSLRLLETPGLGAEARKVVYRSRSHSEVAEAVLALAQAPDEQDAELVLGMLANRKPATDLPVVEREGGVKLEEIEDEDLGWPIRFSAAMVVDRYVGPIRADRFRRTAIRHILRTTESGFEDYYRGPALLSLLPWLERENESDIELALAGKTEAVDSLDDPRPLETLRPPETSMITRPDDPLRGYAAIGMGLYMRDLRGLSQEQRIVPVVRRPHEVARPLRRYTNKLHYLMLNHRESPELRSAAAMGLALGGDPDAAGLIAEAMNEVDETDELFIGYGSLAMVMLGDKRGAIPARKFLQKAISDSEGELVVELPPACVLGRRAMALALGLAGDDKSVMVLRDTWGTHTWVSLEAAWALSWSKNTALVEPMIQQMDRQLGNDKAVLAAYGLGLLLERENPSAYCRLAKGSSYALGLPGVDTTIAAEAVDKNPNGKDPKSQLVEVHTERDYLGPSNMYLYMVMLETPPPAIMRSGD